MFRTNIAFQSKAINFVTWCACTVCLTLAMTQYCTENTWNLACVEICSV